MLNSKRHTLTALAILTLFVSTQALAAEADDILKKVEDTMTAPKDMSADMLMTLKDSDGKTKDRKVSTKQMGTDLRMIKFLSPAEVKGVGFLVISSDEMYLYMPEFGKVRRIASHVKNDNFMGTDFSYSDMGGGDYEDDYSVTLAKKEGTVVTLELKPKNADDIQYSKLVMVVDTANYIPSKIEFFDKAGKLWKVLTQENLKKISGYWTAERMTMTDKKKKHSTVMEMSKIKFDTGMKTKDFSRRRLKRSR